MKKRETSKYLLCFVWQVLWNGQYPPRGDRGIQTKGCYSQSGRQDRRLQTPKPHHVCLGDPGQAPSGESVRQWQRPQRQLHQQVLRSDNSVHVFEQQIAGNRYWGKATGGAASFCTLHLVCEWRGEEAERPRSPYVWSGRSSVVQHDGTMTAFSPEHSGGEREARWKKREEERGKEANKREGRCASTRTESNIKRNERKAEEGEEMRGQERRGKGKERGRKGLAWAAKQEVWALSAMSASFSHFTHTHTHTVLLPRWSCSLRHSSPLLSLSRTHTNDHFTLAYISSPPPPGSSGQRSSSSRVRRAQCRLTTWVGRSSEISLFQLSKHILQQRPFSGGEPVRSTWNKQT